MTDNAPKILSPEEELCKALTQEIKALRKEAIYYKDRLRLRIISQQTGIPVGSLGAFIKWDTLPPARYQLIKRYVDELKERYKSFIELQKETTK